MTDRELLERAARAAGIFLTRETAAAGWPEFDWTADCEPEFDGEYLRGTVFWYGSDGELGGTEELDWNPLADDGDAMRLAVALGISIAQEKRNGCVFVDAGPIQADEEYGADPIAATRRAIVRAAAEMAP